MTGGRDGWCSRSDLILNALDECPNLSCPFHRCLLLLSTYISKPTPLWLRVCLCRAPATCSVTCCYLPCLIIPKPHPLSLLPPSFLFVPRHDLNLIYPAPAHPARHSGILNDTFIHTTVVWKRRPWTCTLPRTSNSEIRLGTWSINSAE
jgi:hypothetical protein